MPESVTGSGSAYRAFVSYSHADRGWCDWLHKALETYRVPSRLVGAQTAHGIIPRKLAPIFRDRDELPSAHDLNNKVAQALADSENLVVICSPHSAHSHWVNEEVLAYKRLDRADRIFCLIVDGEPNASDLSGRAAEECFCPALRFQLGADGQPTSERTEPIAADARPGKDGKANAKLKLIAGMLDVGFDALKQRELQRRNRRMTAIAALALIVMLVTSALAVYALISRHEAVIARQQAVVAQKAAERRQKQAEGLVGFMLGDLNDKLAQVSRLDIMQAVDDKAMAYFDSLPAADATDAALAMRVTALEKIGSVRLDQGHLPAALAAFQAALKVAEPLADAAPANTARQLAYAEIQAFIGKTYWYQNQLDRAQRHFEFAQGILQRARMRAGNSLSLQYQLATVANNIGHVLEMRGRLDDAAIQYKNMLTLCQQLVAAKPGNADWMVQLGMAHNNLGKVSLALGDPATAIAQYANDDSIETRLSARDPKDNNQREKVAILAATLGRTLALMGDAPTGIRDLQRAVAISTRLIAVDPRNTGFQEDVGLYSTQLSRLQRLSGDLRAANALNTRSVAIFAGLTKQDPSNMGWQREYADALTEQAAAWRSTAQSDQAHKPVQSALQILDPLLARQPDDTGTLLSAMMARLLLADLSPDQPARSLREDALKAMQAQKASRADPRLRALEVEALLKLGRSRQAQPLIQQLWNSGYRDPALLALLQHEHIDYPVNAAFARRLAAIVQPDAASATHSSEAARSPAPLAQEKPGRGNSPAH